MKHKIILFILLTVMVTGCIKTKQTYYFNPDGSGKVEFYQAAPLDLMGMTPKGEKYLALESELKKLLFADGIEAWKDVKIEVLPDSSKLFFTGTAYFPDYTKLDSEPFEMQAQLVEIGNGNYKFGFPPEKFAEEAEDYDEEVSQDDTFANLTTEEKIKMIRNQAQMSMGMIRGFMSEMEVDQRFVLPGNISKNNGLKQLNEHTIQFYINGDSLANAMNNVLNDDQIMTELIEAKPNTENFNKLFETKKAQQMIYGKLLGIKMDDPTVVISKVRPIFNYKDEVKAADKEFKALQEKYKD